MVMEPLGRGGMCFVYKARGDDGSVVALKFPYQRPSPDAFRQFVIEGKSLVQLNHPNIVKVHSVGQQEGWPYIVMQYVDGWTLTEEINARKNFSANEVYDLLAPIANALDYVHARDKVHRDVKPGNIRLSSQRRPVLVDFGIVQTGEPGRTSERIPRGSPWYMSPEQTEGKRATGQSDQYSLAIVAYEMLAGRLPFDGDPGSVVRRQRDTKPPLPAGWSEPLKDWMQRALEKNPEERFSSCKEFIDGLRQGYMVTTA
jgi:serine/threonine-protein kinase